MIFKVGKDQLTTLELALTFENLAGYLYEVVNDKFASKEQMLAFLFAKKRSQVVASVSLVSLVYLSSTSVPRELKLRYLSSVY